MCVLKGVEINFKVFDSKIKSTSICAMIVAKYFFESFESHMAFNHASSMLLAYIVTRNLNIIVLCNMCQRNIYVEPTTICFIGL